VDLRPLQVAEADRLIRCAGVLQRPPRVRLERPADERRTEPAHLESISEFGPALSSGIAGSGEEIRTDARR